MYVMVCIWWWSVIISFILLNIGSCALACVYALGCALCVFGFLLLRLIFLFCYLKS